MSDDNVKVAVRMRPFNKREKDLNWECCITIYPELQQTVIVDLDESV